MPFVLVQYFYNPAYIIQGLLYNSLHIEYFVESINIIQKIVLFYIFQIFKTNIF